MALIASERVVAMVQGCSILLGPGSYVELSLAHGECMI